MRHPKQEGVVSFESSASRAQSKRGGRGRGRGGRGGGRGGSRGSATVPVHRPVSIEFNPEARKYDGRVSVTVCVFACV